MSIPKISVIMPVYNMAEYLDETLSSWVNQTLQEIEILCIDDASTDNSLEVLQKWASRDSRIIVYAFTNNKSAWVARKWGIMNCSAEYILFADADDTMEACACEELYAQVQQTPVDILHFDANIINVNDLPEQRIRNMQKFVAPYDGQLFGDEIFTFCFEEKLYQFSLWNKLFSTEICRQAVVDTDDWFLPKAQDKLLYWAIALHAQSYRGIPEKKYYNYFFGRGGTGFNSLTLKQFERYCTMADTANAMHEYLLQKNLLDKYQNIDKANRTTLLKDCMVRFRNEVQDALKGTAFDLLLKKWNTDEVIAALAKTEWYNRNKVANYLLSSQLLKTRTSTVPKTIGTYYHSCANGGAQRVMCDLSILLASMGYEIVIFTDEEPSENDYPIPVNAKRVVLPHHQQVNKENYIERIHVLEGAIREYHIDIMLYHAWVLNMMLWDEIVCKANGVAFIGHCHNVFSLPILRNYGNGIEYIAPYLLADCVVTLSKTDEYFWRHFNSNVHATINPFSEGFDNWHVSSKLDDKQILWVGRMSGEKRPEDALWIMKKVIVQEPNAHLHIVGSNPSETYMENFQKKIVTMELSEHVTMHGFQADVREFYQNASIFLMTSEYEGYPLTLQESKLAGLPCVMYELPYLTLCEGKRGMIPVEANTTAASAAILDLLQNDEKRHEYAREARAHVEELHNFNFQRKWQEIITSIQLPREDTLPEASYIMLNTLLNHHIICTNRINKKAANAANMTGAKNGRSFLCLLRNGIQCCIDHGVMYTFFYSFKKLWRILSHQ